ncbi:hypothetical protein CVT26_004042 [Gymnopilus dilepis]|uniref:Uncharacterized protein n=1 Tax=Gymnopilus dilepis TaxID=231916 RepID=A0A409X1C2_9AGAR|nr:hypothetical protein CVT26_004042 [Gymnopilus dilepis]
MDITLITISLRPSLMKYHTQLLTLSGPSSQDPGKWTLTRIGTPEERMSIQKEIRVIEEKLQEVEGWEKRVKELEGLLGVQELDEENMEGGEHDELERQLLGEKGHVEEAKEENKAAVDASASEVEVKDEGSYVANGNRYSVLPEEDGLEDPMDAQEMQVEAEIEAEAVGGESLA